MILAALGFGLLGAGSAFSAPRYRGEASDHFDGERFFNPGAPEPHGAGGLLKWLAHRERGPWSEHRDEQPGPPPERTVDGGRIRATLVGHATLLVQLDGVNILTDPIFSERASPVAFAGPRRVRPPAVRFEDLPHVDVVLVSHDHYDHLDLPTLRRLYQEHRPTFVVPLGNAAILEQGGIPGAVELDWWQAFAIAPGVKVTCTPSQHFSNRGPFDAATALWASYMIEGKSGRVYFAGDTGYGPHFKEIGARLGAPRLALLPIGAFRPRWFMQPVHMAPSEAVQAARDLGAATSRPMHYGTFRLADDGEAEPLQALAEALQATPGVRFEVPAFGEGRDAPP